MSKLIGLSGKARTGKDTVASILKLASSWKNSNYFKMRYPDQTQFIINSLKLHSKVAYSESSYVSFAFADILKSVITLIFNIEDVENLYDEVFKNSANSLDVKGEDGHILTYREVLQKFGTEVGRTVDPDLWIKSAFSFMKPDVDYIITDIRFQNELQACKEKGTITIKINREAPEMDHISEHDLDSCTDFDYVIDNNGTLEELVDKVLQLNLV